MFPDKFDINLSLKYPFLKSAVLSDVRQAANSFHDSLAKISQMALSSKGTAFSLGEPIFAVLFN